VNTVRADNLKTRLIRAALVAATMSVVAAVSVPTIFATNPTPGTSTKKPPVPVINEEYALNFYKDYLPEAYNFITIVKNKDPKAYNDNYRQRMIDNTRRLSDMKRDRPEWFEPSVADSRYSFRTLQLSKDLHSPDPTWTPADIDKKKAELKEVASLQFDVRQELRKLQLKEQQNRMLEIQQSLKAMQDQLDNREKQNDEIINNHIEQIMKPKPNTDW
jgi:hypothetical protein